ncbi:MAG: PIN domain-containing protein [Vicinamibacterales bacterium]
MVLVDTSVWIEVFGRRNTLRLEDFVDFDDVVTCLPVRQEVLQGFGDERAYRIAREAFDAFPVVESPLGKEVVDEAVALYRSARRSGLTVRSGVDCLIAACALRNGLQLLHSDRDFDLLARVSRLEARNIARRR